MSYLSRGLSRLNPHRTPADLAVLKFLGQDSTRVEKDILDVFTSRDDCLGDFDFNPIHIAVLEMYDAEDTERPSLEEYVHWILAPIQKLDHKRPATEADLTTG